MTVDTTELCQGCPSCYTDTGDSWLELPLTEEFCNSIPTNVDILKSLGSLYIDLDGADGEDITPLQQPSPPMKNLALDDVLKRTE